MTINVNKVTLYVQDQAAALDFWTQKVGFEVTTDQPYGPETRWIEVSPPGGGVGLVLFKAGPEWPTLSQEQPNYVLFDTEDIVKTHEDLAARGVPFDAPPTEEPWGWSAVFLDNEGHRFHLSQR
ncbi:VOC family protein [Nonomuraea endophytica]|uniref:VOC family protein n=1 Tax=Nonomuraea endophytica TaxID=714136 RepID=UPI0037C6B303